MQGVSLTIESFPGTSWPSVLRWFTHSTFWIRSIFLASTRANPARAKSNLVLAVSRYGICSPSRLPSKERS